MKIAVTGATGFLGRYLVDELAAQGHLLRAWYRPTSDRGGFGPLGPAIEWIEGSLGDPNSAAELVQGCEAVVHSALDHPGGGFRGGEGDLISFAEHNLIGTLRLIEAARAAGVPRFVFISTCAVHEKILDDRPLDETHPLWPLSHYGAHKAAIEKFVHSYGIGQGYEICALRPTGIYGLAWPPRASRWYDLVEAVVAGRDVTCRRGGKEVHAADVARAALLLIKAPSVAGQAFNCYDRYVSELEVATLAKQISGSSAKIDGSRMTPKHQIETGKLRGLGFEFGGLPRLEETVAELCEAVRRA